MSGIHEGSPGVVAFSGEMGKCEWCDARFARPARGRRKRFCSTACQLKAKDRRRFRERGTLVLKRCEQCGILFEYRSATKPRRFCTGCSPRSADKQPSTKRGHCRGCGGKVEGRAWYCAGCRVKHRRKRTRTKERPRGTMAQRGYGSEHSRLRKRWKEVIDREGAVCARCGKPIVPGMLWDLGHVDGRKDVWAGPEHRRCNRATSRHRVQRQRRRKWSRAW